MHDRRTRKIGGTAWDLYMYINSHSGFIKKNILIMF